MIWASWADFWAMGGYGLYVWGSYAVVALAMLAEVLGARQRQRKAIAQIQQNKEETEL